MAKIFLDASIIADWLLIKLTIKNNPTKEKEFLDNIKQTRKNGYYSYKIIEFVRYGYKDFDFYSSDLAIMEVLSVIFERYVLEEMHEKGIPIKYFHKYREEIALPPDKNKEIHNEFYNFNKIFILKNKIVLTNKINHLTCKYLICDYNIDNHDAFLVSQCKESGCQYFLTNDTRLARMLNKYRTPKLINSDTLFQDLKNLI